MSSPLQKMSGWIKDRDRKIVEAKLHLYFCMHLYKRQVERGLLSLHEHPAAATSWKLSEATHVANVKVVQIVTVDLCMYGPTTKSADTGKQVAAMKSIKVMTNNQFLAIELS